MQFAVAGPVVRGMAWLVDVLIRTVFLIAVYIVFGASLVSTDGAYASFGVLLIVQFLVTWFYTTAFEAITGTTPGKRMYGLWVVHDNATPITASGAIIRNFLRTVDSLPFANLTGLVTMIIDGRFRRLGDLAAGTLVIYRDKAISSSEFVHEHGAPPPDWLTRDDRQAIVDFAERCDSVSEERQQELASVLAHLVDDEAVSVNTLKSWAQWILRGQENAQPTGL